MRARFIVGAAGIGSVTLVLAAMCVVVAQNPPLTRSRSAARANLLPRNEVAAQEATELRREVATLNDPGASVPPITFPRTSGPNYQETAIAPAPPKPAIVELKSGLKLDGQLASGPIPCLVMFGEASLPLETIRGIRMSDELVNDEAGQARPTSATIVLENGDSLTGMPRLEVIRLQTDWGEAIVKLTHVKSLLLTSESVTWQQLEGRWRLIPVELTPADAADLPSLNDFAPPETSNSAPPIIPRASSLLPPADAAPPATGEPAKND